MKRSRWPTWGLAVLLCMPGAPAHAEIYGYVDPNGTAHFAVEKLDGRYHLMFRDGQSFDTAAGLGSALAGGVPPASAQSLMNLFEKSPGYKVARAALQDAARRHAVDYELLQALVATESGFNAQAVSPKGAVGLMQVLPETAQRYGVQAGKGQTMQARLYDPHVNVATGSRYLHDLIRMYSGRLELALAAYNAGEGAVQKAGDRIPNYPETQNYVKTVLALYAYLKPGAPGVSVSAARGGGRVPGRIRMELPGRG
jgi:soluble lytic murein transglycosylase-like protein